MSWDSKLKEWGGADLSFLTEDGEVINIVICGEPELFVGKYKGQETKRIAFPVATVDGVTILVVGMRTARRLAKHKNVTTTPPMRSFATVSKATRTQPMTSKRLQTNS